MTTACNLANFADDHADAKPPAPGRRKRALQSSRNGNSTALNAPANALHCALSIVLTFAKPNLVRTRSKPSTLCP